eukprot:403339277
MKNSDDQSDHQSSSNGEHNKQESAIKRLRIGLFIRCFALFLILLTGAFPQWGLRCDTSVYPLQLMFLFILDFVMAIIDLLLGLFLPSSIVDQKLYLDEEQHKDPVQNLIEVQQEDNFERYIVKHMILQQQQAQEDLIETKLNQEGNIDKKSKQRVSLDRNISSRRLSNQDQSSARTKTNEQQETKLQRQTEAHSLRNFPAYLYRDHNEIQSEEANIFNIPAPVQNQNEDNEQNQSPNIQLNTQNQKCRVRGYTYQNTYKSRLNDGNNKLNIKITRCSESQTQNLFEDPGQDSKLRGRLMTQNFAQNNHQQKSYFDRSKKFSIKNNLNPPPQQIYEESINSDSNFDEDFDFQNRLLNQAKQSTKQGKTITTQDQIEKVTSQSKEEEMKRALDFWRYVRVQTLIFSIVNLLWSTYGLVMGALGIIVMEIPVVKNLAKLECQQGITGNMSVWESGHMISEMFITLHVVLVMLYATLFYIVFFYVPFRHNRIKKTNKEIQADRRAYRLKLTKKHEKRAYLQYVQMNQQSNNLYNEDTQSSSLTMLEEDLLQNQQAKESFIVDQLENQIISKNQVQDKVIEKNRINLSNSLINIGHLDQSTFLRQNTQIETNISNNNYYYSNISNGNYHEIDKIE